jgi:poly(3-hydroxybutyrate) depolymerase
MHSDDTEQSSKVKTEFVRRSRVEKEDLAGHDVVVEREDDEPLVEWVEHDQGLERGGYRMTIAQSSANAKIASVRSVVELTDVEDDPDDQEQWQELCSEDGQHRLESQSKRQEGHIVQRPVDDEAAVRSERNRTGRESKSTWT